MIIGSRSCDRACARVGVMMMVIAVAQRHLRNSIGVMAEVQKRQDATEGGIGPPSRQPAVIATYSLGRSAVRPPPAKRASWGVRILR